MIKLRAKKQMRTPRGAEWLDVDLDISTGEFVTLFGRSGAGKTTLLRILAGLTVVPEGYIEVDGQVWFDSRKGINLPVQQRRTGFVFQEGNLFPHMTVLENLEYACADKEARGMLREWIVTMGLKGLERQKPDHISGGQKQRAALVRALLNRPRILLLDEPLSDLDVPARSDLQDEILKAHQKTQITTLLVSHDLAEVFKLSKKVFVIDHGRIIKTGRPQDVFVTDDVSGQFQFAGEIIEIRKEGAVNMVTLSIGDNVTKLVVADKEIRGLTAGSKITVAAKSFNPVIINTVSPV